MNIESSELNFLNQLTTEIIILDKDYKIIWLNDSALNKGWYINSKIEDNHISKQLSEETASSVMNLLNKSQSPNNINIVLLKKGNNKIYNYDNSKDNDMYLCNKPENDSENPTLLESKPKLSIQ